MSVPSWVKPGAKCVCVDTSWLGHKGTTCPLELKKTYTVLGVSVGRGYYRGRVFTGGVVHLSGVDNPDAPGSGFAIERFRPLVTRTQEEDLALFRHHLDGLTVGAGV